MKAYLLSAVGVIFLTVIISFIAPEGKLKKSVNFVLRIISICILISPVTKMFNFSKTTAEYTYDYDYVCSVYSQSQSRLLTQKVEDELGVECICIVEVAYENGKFAEKGVTAEGNFEGVQTIETIREYLRELGYIHITVNDKSDSVP